MCVTAFCGLFGGVFPGALPLRIFQARRKKFPQILEDCGNGSQCINPLLYDPPGLAEESKPSPAQEVKNEFPEPMTPGDSFLTPGWGVGQDASETSRETMIDFLSWGGF